MIYYISGPMSGQPNHNREAFNECEAYLKTLGDQVRVLNPANNHVPGTPVDYEALMAKAKLQVLTADAIVLLPGWRESHGAVTEARWANNTTRLYEYGPGRVGRFTAIARASLPAVAPPRVLDLPLVPLDTSVWTTGRVIQAGRVALQSGYDAGRSAQLAESVPVHDYAGATDGGGYKGSMDDSAKARIALVPSALVLAAARALGYGAEKYAPNNWRRGMAWSEVYSALQRHLLAWNDREETDSASGLGHLDHAAACLGFLTEYDAHERYATFDDRFGQDITT